MYYILLKKNYCLFFSFFSPNIFAISSHTILSFVNFKYILKYAYGRIEYYGQSIIIPFLRNVLMSGTSVAQSDI